MPPVLVPPPPSMACPSMENDWAHARPHKQPRAKSELASRANAFMVEPFGAFSRLENRDRPARGAEGRGGGELVAGRRGIAAGAEQDDIVGQLQTLLRAQDGGE